MNNHNWEIVITEYYEMDADWVCSKCGIKTAREHKRGKGGSWLDTKESLEDFETRITLDQKWNNIPLQCSKE